MNVSCRVHVSVETDATGAAFEDAITESELGFRHATVRAHLRRWEEPVDHDHAMTAVAGLVRELATQLKQVDVEDRT